MRGELYEERAGSPISRDKNERANAATRWRGEVHAGSFVFLKTGNIGRIVDIWQADDEEMVVRLLVHRRIPRCRVHFEVDACSGTFDAIRSIVEPIPWYKASDVIVASVPEFE